MTSQVRLENLQLLRFIAAFFVVFAHVELYEFVASGVSQSMFGFGAIGVDIFFIISGFIMCHVSESLRFRGGARSAIYFHARRVIRIVPLYFLFSVLTLCIALINYRYPLAYKFLMDRHYGVEHTSLRFLFASITFLHFEKKLPIFSIGWTLIYEFWFYTLFSLCIFIKSKVTIFFSIYASLVVFLDIFSIDRGTGWMTIILSPLMLEFCFGIFLYHILHRFENARFKSWFLPSILALILFFCIAYYEPKLSNSTMESYRRVMTWGVASFFVVLLFLCFEGAFRLPKYLIFLGDASYSIYLTHWLCMTLTPYLFWSIGWFPKGPMTPYVFFSVLVAMISAIAIYVYFERPMLDFFTKYVNKIKPRTDMLSAAV